MTPAERSAQWNREHYGYHRIYNILGNCRRRAEKKGLEYNLDPEWFKEKCKDVCEITGLPFSVEAPREKNKRNPLSPSIDRIDTNKGYTKDNCRVILWAVNRALGDDGLGFLYYWCKTLVDKVEDGRKKER